MCPKHFSHAKTSGHGVRAAPSFTTSSTRPRTEEPRPCLSEGLVRKMFLYVLQVSNCIQLPPVTSCSSRVFLDRTWITSTPIFNRFFTKLYLRIQKSRWSMLKKDMSAYLFQYTILVVCLWKPLQSMLTVGTPACFPRSFRSLSELRKGEPRKVEPRKVELRTVIWALPKTTTSASIIFSRIRVYAFFCWTFDTMIRGVQRS